MPHPGGIHTASAWGVGGEPAGTRGRDREDPTQSEGKGVNPCVCGVPCPSRAQKMQDRSTAATLSGIQTAGWASSVSVSRGDASPVAAGVYTLGATPVGTSMARTSPGPSCRSLAARHPHPLQMVFFLMGLGDGLSFLKVEGFYGRAQWKYVFQIHTWFWLSHVSLARPL